MNNQCENTFDEALWMMLAFYRIGQPRRNSCMLCVVRMEKKDWRVPQVLQVKLRDTRG